MAAGAEPLVEWINGARGVGKTAAAWAERAPRKLLDAYRAERGEVEPGSTVLRDRGARCNARAKRWIQAESRQPERGEKA